MKDIFTFCKTTLTYTLNNYGLVFYENYIWKWCHAPHKLAEGTVRTEEFHTGDQNLNAVSEEWGSHVFLINFCIPKPHSCRGSWLESIFRNERTREMMLRQEWRCLLCVRPKKVEVDLGEERQWIQGEGNWVVANQASMTAEKYPFRDLDHGLKISLQHCMTRMMTLAQ